MNKHWISVWGCPISRASKSSAEWMKNITVRMRMLMTVGGTKLRIRFSNIFNSETSTIERVSVSVAGEKREQDTSRLVELSFGGETKCVMEAGKDALSDEVDFNFSAGEYLCLNMYFKDFTHLLTGHRNSGKYIKRWVCDGDCCDLKDLPPEGYAEGTVYPFINSIEALCDEDCYTIACFGDSITAQTWPDRFSLRLLSEGKTKVAAVRKGIGGSRVLREYHQQSMWHCGPKGTDRFQREVCLPGVKKVFILHGINDIIHPEKDAKFCPMSHLPTVEELCEGLKYYIDTAHKNNIEVYISKILPFGACSCFDDEREKIRLGVNAWIDSCDADGILPFEESILDPQCPSKLLKEFDCGDGLHPSGDGAQKMADCIPEKII